ncbi:UNKNOWN [Stylonychia lemnae]|uniref:Uncharacterized protein n=1 Tax=Stylonychia lemnae TaxID=5949 RepID=A0A078A2C8_STYLE|nr:UNKNOWN [Stylonychia lemnae]|eukprot:CDW76356.1 UNKNOWN [Stylonychia lemnae]
MIVLPLALYILIIVLYSLLGGEFTSKLICQNIRSALCMSTKHLQINAKVHNVQTANVDKEIEQRRRIEIIIEKHEQNIEKEINDTSQVKSAQKTEEKSQDKTKATATQEQKDTNDSTNQKELDQQQDLAQNHNQIMSKTNQLQQNQRNKNIIEINIEKHEAFIPKQPSNSAQNLRKNLEINDLPSNNLRQQNNSNRSERMLEIKKNVDQEWDDMSNGSKNQCLNSNSDSEK